MYCERCGHSDVGSRAQCGYCGASLPLICSGCRNVNSSGAKFCVRCGARLTRSSDDRRADSQEGERRQLTVLYCDLVVAPMRSGRLDPEDIRGIRRRFRDACATVVHERRGFLGEQFGDGLFAYFGYPQAHEDDAERAINAGLQICDGVAAVARQENLEPDVRIGIATGLMVVDDLTGTEPLPEGTVVGAATSLAVMLHALADENAVVVSALTHELAGALFSYADLGLQKLRGVPAPTQAWRVTGRHAASSRFAAQHGQLPPLFGRARELEQLLECWRSAKQGQGQVALISGEDGMGKSHIVETLRERALKEDAPALRYYRAPMYQSSALLPVVRQIERAAGISREDPGPLSLEKLKTYLREEGSDSSLTAGLADLLALPGQSEAVEGTGNDKKADGRQRRIERLLDVLVKRDVGFATERPVLIVFEDAHWSDPATLRFLGRLMKRITEKRVLLLITHRSDFSVSAWQEAAHLTTIELGGLREADSKAMIGWVAGGKALPAAVVDEIVARASGVPLFIVEVTKTLLQSEVLEQGPDGYLLTEPLGPLTIPLSLKDSLMVKLDKLGAAKEVTQIAAVLGSRFSKTQMAAITQLSDKRLEDAIAEMIETDVIRPVPGHGGDYDFCYPLLREVAYESLLLTKRRKLHRRAAQLLERVYPATAEREPELLAHHYAGAGVNDRAIAYGWRAAERAMAGRAFGIAISQLKRVLVLLPTLPESDERVESEKRCRAMLGRALAGFRGYADWAELDEARELLNS